MVTAELDRIDLENLVKGVQPDYSVFDRLLLIKAGFSYSDQYGCVTWNNLERLTEKELFDLYVICKESKSKSTQ